MYIYNYRMELVRNHLTPITEELFENVVIEDNKYRVSHSGKPGTSFEVFIDHVGLSESLSGDIKCCIYTVSRKDIKEMEELLSDQIGKRLQTKITELETKLNWLKEGLENCYKDCVSN